LTLNQKYLLEKNGRRCLPRPHPTTSLLFPSIDNIQAVNLSGE